MAEPWQFEKVTLPSGLRMRIARAGERGPLMVMLHGFPECWYSWRHQLRAFAGSFICVAPEMRGYGETDAPVGVENYTIDLLVDDVAGLIEALGPNKLGRNKAIVVGHDWGGGVAWATAMMRPEVVERLIVMNCPHLAAFRKHLTSNPRQLARSWYMFFFQLPWLPEALFRSRDFAIFRQMRTSAVNKEAFSDDDLRHFRAAFAGRRYSVSAAINYYRAMMRGNFLLKPRSLEWLERKISAPTLLIWGEQDFALGKELTYGMEGLFTGPFAIKYIPDSGHWVQQERPELVNQYMREFLSDLIARPARTET